MDVVTPVDVAATANVMSLYGIPQNMHTPRHTGVSAGMHPAGTGGSHDFRRTADSEASS